MKPNEGKRESHSRESMKPYEGKHETPERENMKPYEGKHETLSFRIASMTAPRVSY